MPNEEFTQWPSGIRDTTEFPTISIEVQANLREHLAAFCSLDGVGWQDYSGQAAQGNLNTAESRLRTYRKMYERLGLIYRDEDKIRLSKLGIGIRDLENNLKLAREKLLDGLRVSAIDVLARYQLKNPIDGPSLPDSCDVQPYLVIWKMMRSLDNKINYEEMNRVVLRIVSMNQVDAAIQKIRTAREAQAAAGHAFTGEELTEHLGAPVHSDQPSARIAPWFSAAGWGGLLIGQNQDDDGYRRLVDSAVPFIDRKIANPPSFFHTEDQDVWLQYYIGDATVPVPENEEGSGNVEEQTPPDESLRKTEGCNIILYGVPGSGKSWTIQNEYCAREEFMERLVFHPDYMYTDFIGQILPVVKDDKVRYEFRPGPFTKLLKKAYWNPQQEYYLIVEEINRGNAPAIFGEIFQLLDRITDENADYPVGTSEYPITNANIAKEVYGDPERMVRIPSNLSIIGTMNTSDQNVFTLDTAFQRRWTMRMIPNSFDRHMFANNPILDTSVSWRAFCAAINDEILRRNNVTSSEDKRLGAYFITASDLKINRAEITAARDSKEWIKARHDNARFAEKVLKYLWDDAFKFVHSETFDTKLYPSLDAVIDAFCNDNGDSRFKVFNENMVKAIQDAAQQYPARVVE